MSYRLKGGSRCKISYGAISDTLSDDYSSLSLSAPIATLANPVPDPENVGSVTVDFLSPEIIEITSGQMILKDDSGTEIETTQGVASELSIKFNFIIGHRFDEDVTYCFVDITGKDVVGNEYSNSFDKEQLAVT